MDKIKLILGLFLLIFLSSVLNEVKAQPTVEELQTQILELKADYNITKEAINAKTNLQLKNDEAKYKFNKDNIVSTAMFLNNYSEALDLLLLQNSFANYFTYITELNNPTTSGLGFSLHEVVMSKMKVLEENLNGDKYGFFDGIVKKIIDIPFVQNIVKSPIVQTVTSLAATIIPAGGVLTSISNLVASSMVSDNDSDLDSTAFKDIQTNLDKIFQIYQTLSNINQQFSSEQLSIQLKAEALRGEIKVLLVDRAISLYNLNESDIAKLDTMSISNLNRKYFNTSSAIYTRINEIENSVGSQNYADLLNQNSLDYSKDDKNVLKYMMGNYETIYIQFQQSMEINNSQISNFLKNKDNFTVIGGKDKPEVRESSVRKLNELYKDLNKKSENVNKIGSLKDQLKEIEEHY